MEITDELNVRLYLIFENKLDKIRDNLGLPDVVSTESEEYYRFVRAWDEFLEKMGVVIGIDARRDPLAAWRTIPGRVDPRDAWVAVGDPLYTRGGPVKGYLRVPKDIAEKALILGELP